MVPSAHKAFKNRARWPAGIVLRSCFGSYQRNLGTLSVLDRLPCAQDMAKIQRFLSKDYSYFRLFLVRSDAHNVITPVSCIKNDAEVRAVIVKKLGSHIDSEHIQLPLFCSVSIFYS